MAERGAAPPARRHQWEAVVLRAVEGGGGEEEDGGGQRVLFEAVLLRVGAVVAPRRLRCLPAGRYLSVGRALRPRRSQRQQRAPGAGGAGGAAAAESGAPGRRGAQPGAAPEANVRGGAVGAAAPALLCQPRAAGAGGRRLPALVLPERCLHGAVGRGAAPGLPLLRHHLRPAPRWLPRAGPHHPPGAGGSRGPHLRH